MSASAPAALITGGTSGIGRSTALLLRDRGYRVAVTGRSLESVRAARDHLPGDIQAYVADAGDATRCRDLAARLSDDLGPVDLLFLNAGTYVPAMVPDVDESSFDTQVDVNLRGPFFTLQATLPSVVDGGSVVMTVGVAARHGAPGSTVSAATRGGLLAMLPSLALELAPRRITVNVVSPGATDTPLWDKLGVSAAARDALSAQIPLGRFASSSDVAETVAWLSSAAARHVTGQEITVAGGQGLGT